MASDVELWAAIKDSEIWKLIESTLDTRREMLFATEFGQAKTSHDRALAQGAINEITRLKNLPSMALNVMMKRAEEQRATGHGLDALNPRDPEDYDG